MEPRVTIRIQLTDDDATHDLEKVPQNLEELYSAVYSKTGAVNFKVLFRDHQITSITDLFTAYLENKDPVLHLLVDEILTAPGYMSSSVDEMYKMKSTTEGKLTVQDGTISETDLLRIIDEMTEVTVMQFRHDEFARFIPVAYPYYLNVFAQMGATFLFVMSFLYADFSSVKGVKKEQA